jgi:hypothetical protein
MFAAALPLLSVDRQYPQRKQSQMSKTTKDDFEEFARTNPVQFRLEIQAALERLASEGVIFDTGKKRWSKHTGRYETVWSAVERKTLN